MSLIERLGADLKTALKGGDQFRVGVLRLITAALHNRSIDKRAKGGEEKLTDDEVLQVIASEAKKRREAAEAFRKGNRADLADNEEKELTIITVYLPKQMSEAEVKAAVETILKKSGAADFAGAMKAVMAELKGKADAKLISELLRAKFG